MKMKLMIVPMNEPQKSLGAYFASTGDCSISPARIMAEKMNVNMQAAKRMKRKVDAVIDLFSRWKEANEKIETFFEFLCRLVNLVESFFETRNASIQELNEIIVAL